MLSLKMFDAVYLAMETPINSLKCNLILT